MDRLPVKIKLDVNRHCIETEIKRLYNQCVSRFFSAPAERDILEGRIALLQYALENLDFPSVRSRHPHLAGGCGGDVFLVAGIDDSKYILTPEKEIRF